MEQYLLYAAHASNLAMPSALTPCMNLSLDFPHCAIQLCLKNCNPTRSSFDNTVQFAQDVFGFIKLSILKHVVIIPLQQSLDSS